MGWVKGGVKETHNLTLCLGRYTLASKMENRHKLLDEATNRISETEMTEKDAKSAAVDYYETVTKPSIESKSTEFLSRNETLKALELVNEVVDSIEKTEGLLLNKTPAKAYYDHDVSGNVRFLYDLSKMDITEQNKLINSHLITTEFLYSATKPLQGSPDAEIQFKVIFFPVGSRDLVKDLKSDYWVQLIFGHEHQQFRPGAISEANEHGLVLTDAISKIDKLAEKVVSAEIFKRKPYLTSFNYYEPSEREPWGGSGPTN